jgi:hypothetical protein
MRLPEPSGTAFVLSSDWLKSGCETPGSLANSASKSSGEGGWKRVAMLQPVKCSGSSKLGGSGAKASDTQHMAYLTSGAHNARFRLFVRTVSAKKKSIRAQSRDWRLQGDQNPPYLGETSPAPGRRSRPHGRMRTIPGAMDISGIWTARSRSWLRPWVASRHPARSARDLGSHESRDRNLLTPSAKKPPTAVASYVSVQSRSRRCPYRRELSSSARGGANGGRARARKFPLFGPRDPTKGERAPGAVWPLPGG